jgi:hypothetical protein
MAYWIPAFAGYDGRLRWDAVPAVASQHSSYLPPNSRCINQPSNPAAASGRAEGLLRAGAGRYGPGGG